MSTYTVRIMAALPNQEPVEWFRGYERLHPKTWAFFKRDVAPEWTVWTEYRLPDRHCLTPRIRFARKTGAEKLRLHLTQEQKKTASIL